MSRKPFLQQFRELIEKEGYNDISKFVNDWISDGGSFRTLHQWVLLKGVDVVYYNIWLNLRKYLTVPFDYDSSYKYKWDSIAKTKGYDTFEELINDYKNKEYTSTEMARELGITRRGLNYILTRLKNEGKSWEDRYKGDGKVGQKFVDKDGFTMTDAKEKWDRILKKKGYNSLTEAVTTLSSRGLNIPRMAEELEVSEKALRWRIQKANINISTGKKPRKSSLKGIL